MFSVAVTDHVMIAHSFRGEIFGPAQGLHGGTYVITAAFQRVHLDEMGLVIDIGLAHQLLAEVLAPLRYRNLDELPDFEGKNTTTEFLAGWIHQRLADRAREHFSGSLRIQMSESHLAWAAFEGPV